MNSISNFQRLARLAGIAAAGFLCFAVGLRAGIHDLAVGQVSTTTVTATWTSDDTSTLPSAALFYDAELTHPVDEVLEWEWHPLPELGTPRRPGDALQREEARRIRDRMRDRGRVLLRIGGLNPHQTYFLVAQELHSGTNAIISESAPVEFSTAARTRMITESRQLVVTFNALAPEEREGALVRIDVPNSPYPLFATLLNVGSGAQAIADLSALLDSSGFTQRVPEGALELTISLPDLPLAPLIATVPFDGSFVIAAHTPVLFATGEPVVAGYIFDAIAHQQLSVPFTITIRAVDTFGQPVPSFDGNVTLSATANLAVGSGPTTNFSGGILSGHEVRIDQTGPVQLEVVDSLGRTGQSNTFNVFEVYYNLMLNADPEIGGTVTGSGTYPEGGTAPIEAVPAEGFNFVRWIGEVVEDEFSPSSSVIMGGDRFLTAVFRRHTVPAYSDWALTHFLRNADNEAISGLDRDPNQNGIINLLEFAFGRDPLSSDASHRMPELTRTATNALAFSFHRRANHPQLEYIIEVSTDMEQASWAPYFPAPEDITTHSEDGEIEEVHVNIQLAGPVFVRLQVRFLSP